jgi:acyl-CoA synthetase (AMP-forming)/AMP-acid ligase II
VRTASEERIARYRREGWWGDTHTWQIFEATARRDPAAIALIDPPNRAAIAGGEPLSLDWAAVRERALAVAAWLRAEGVGEGDVVLVQLPNTVEAVLCLLAVSALGAIASPVPMQYGPHELRGIAAALMPRVFVSAEQFRGADPAPACNAVMPADVRCLSLGPERLCTLPAADGITLAQPSADDVFTLCWTSGTTGAPKAVPRSHNQWRAQTVAVMGMGLAPGMRMLCPFPLVNMASLSGFFYPWLELGGTLLLHHPIDLPVFLAQISGERVAYTVAPPALLNMLLKQPGLLGAHDLSALRIVASGSAPLAPWMVRAFEEEHGIAVVNVFGSNEGVSLLSATDDVPDPAQRAVLFPRYGVPGLAWSNPIASRIGTRLVDPASGAVVDAPGVVAELQITGPNVMDGYLGAPAQDPAVFSADGWFRSGDLFEIAPEHPRFYRFAGRLKEIIVRGGMKISPEELDTLLAGHPDVAEVAVAGYACAILGERVGAAVVMRGERAPALADIGSYLEEQGVARIKWPERLICLPALPRNPLGKVLRHEVAARLAEAEPPSTGESS